MSNNPILIDKDLPLHKETDPQILANDLRPDGVYLVEVWDMMGNYRHGVFSTAHKARSWMESLPVSCRMMCAPFVLDQPDAGNEVRH